jgi:hypothetical protein
MRSIAALLTAFFFSMPAQAQTAFDPHTVSYVLCVTNETRKLALATPQIEKNAIIERSFAACGDAEAEARKALADQGISKTALDERFGIIKKFIRQTAEDDIDRLRINRVPR